jgi:hypothetical protein
MNFKLAEMRCDSEGICQLGDATVKALRLKRVYILAYLVAEKSDPFCWQNFSEQES